MERTRFERKSHTDNWDVDAWSQRQANRIRRRKEKRELRAHMDTWQNGIAAPR